MEQQITSPQDATKFIDREHERQMYASFLTQDTPWLLLITGLAGSGKSALLDQLKDQTSAQDIPVILLDFAQSWLQTDILTILEKMAEQLEKIPDQQLALRNEFFSLFERKLKKSRRSFSRSDEKISWMVFKAEQADREQLQWVSQARDAFEEKEWAVERAEEAFYALVESLQLKRLVIILDTSEWLYVPKGVNVSKVGKWIINSFLPRLHQHMQQQGKPCHFVITSRERVTLEKVREEEKTE